MTLHCWWWVIGNFEIIINIYRVKCWPTFSLTKFIETLIYFHDFLYETPKNTTAQLIIQFASYQQMICLLSFWTNECQLCLSLSTYVFSFSFRNNILISINCLQNTFFHRIYQIHVFICIAYSFLLLIIK